MIKCDRTSCKNNKAKFIDNKEDKICMLDCIELDTYHSDTNIDGVVICRNFIYGSKTFLKPYQEGYVY